MWFIMYIMYKDIPVMWFDDTITGDVQVLVQDKLPLELRGIVVKWTAQLETSMTSYFGNVNEVIKHAVVYRGHIRDAITDWLAGRVLTLSREHAKKILNAYGFDQAPDDITKMKIALACRGVSILDSYWIKYSDADGATWDTVDIRRNALTDVMVNVALKGSSLTFRNKNLLTPEISTFGMYAKAWIRKEDGLYLYKTGNQGSGYEARVEVLVSKILDCLNVNHLKYELEGYEGLSCCVCKCMTNGEYDLATAMSVMSYCNKNELDFNKYTMGSQFVEDFLKMAQVDYLISNPDRHSQNWGYYLKDCEIVGLHPLYDHNNAFDIALLWDDAAYIAWPGHTMREAAQYGIKRYPVKIVQPISKEWFMTERQLKSFIWKLQDLGVAFKQTQEYIMGE